MGKSRKIHKIGFQGVPGCNSAVAAERYDEEMVPVPFKTFEQIFTAVDRGHIGWGMVPVENSLEGSVKDVNKLLRTCELKIVGEVNLPISYSLLAKEDTDIEVVYSHPQALGQCSRFISDNGLEAVPYYDTAGAALMISEEDMDGAAAIARPECAELYGLEDIESGIEDSHQNMTRFVVISRDGIHEGDKVSIVFSAEHEPGALYRVLKIFSDAGINLTRIESVPTRDSPWTYDFFLDFKVKEGYENALSDVEYEAVRFKHLGLYDESD